MKSLRKLSLAHAISTSLRIVTIKDLKVNEKESGNFKKGSYNKNFYRGKKK